MKNFFKKISIYFLSGILVVAFSNCELTKNANNKQKGAVIGSAGGALLGAILGNNLGKGGKSKIGAVIGGVVGGTAGVLIGKKMDNQAEKIGNEIPGADVERVDNSILITFDENSGVHFDTNQSKIPADSKVVLDKLAKVFNEYPNTNILVVGHTDSSGNDDYNMTLSEKRAKSVTNYLISDGIAASRFETVWYGETQPTHDNTTAEGRAKNRRVNLAIVPNEAMKQEAMKEANNN